MRRPGPSTAIPLKRLKSLIERALSVTRRGNYPFSEVTKRATCDENLLLIQVFKLVQSGSWVGWEGAIVHKPFLLSNVDSGHCIYFISKPQ